MNARPPSKDVSLKRDPFSTLVFWFPVVFTLAAVLLISAILLSPMEWGVMDDPSLLRDFQARYGDFSLWEYIRGFLQGERTWGLYRPVYGVWNYLLYGVFATGFQLPPAILYALNAVLVYASLALFGAEFARTLPERARERGFSFFLLGTLIFTPSLNLVSLLSLQEKFPILATALSLHLLSKNRRVDDVLAFLVFWIGPLAKSTGIVYGIPILFLLKERGRSGKSVRMGWDRTLASFFVASILSWGLFARSVAMSGHYTRRYQWAWDVFPRYFQVGETWAIAVALIFILSLFFSWRSKLTYFSSLSWPFALFAWILLMLPWGISGYLWSVITPLFAACFAIIGIGLTEKINRSEIRSTFPALFFLLIAISFAHFLVKGKRLVSRSVETGKVVTWLKSEEAKASPEIWIAFPCSEAAGTLTLLSEHRPGIRMWRKGDALAPQAAFLTWWECANTPSTEDVHGSFSLNRDFGSWKIYRYEP